jgi:hypothetical protein
LWVGKRVSSHSGIWRGEEGYDQFKGGLFQAKGSGDTPFFCQEKENTDILADFEHFEAQKVPKKLKICTKQLFGVVFKVL